MNLSFAVVEIEPVFEDNVVVPSELLKESPVHPPESPILPPQPAVLATCDVTSSSPASKGHSVTYSSRSPSPSYSNPSSQDVETATESEDRVSQASSVESEPMVVISSSSETSLPSSVVSTASSDSLTVVESAKTLKISPAEIDPTILPSKLIDLKDKPVSVCQTWTWLGSFF